MAKSKITKSRRGNDLVTLTLGPKEAGKVVAVLQSFTEDTNVASVYEALVSARTQSRNAKIFEVEEDIEITRTLESV